MHHLILLQIFEYMQNNPAIFQSFLMQIIKIYTMPMTNVNTEQDIVFTLLENNIYHKDFKDFGNANVAAATPSSLLKGELSVPTRI